MNMSNQSYAQNSVDLIFFCENSNFTNPLKMRNL